MDNKPERMTMKEAWERGVDIGNDMNASRAKQRYIIASRVKALRTEKQISQEKFSEMIHANFLTYKGYENCKSDIPIFYLVRIADELDTTLDYLCGRTETKYDSSLEKRIALLEDYIFHKNESK